MPKIYEIPEEKRKLKKKDLEEMEKIKAGQPKKEERKPGQFRKKLKKRLGRALDIFVRGPERILEERAESKARKEERKFTAEEAEKGRKHDIYLETLKGKPKRQIR